MNDYKRFFIFFLLIFFFSCAQNRVEVRYKNFYNFGNILKIKTLEFQPFPDNIAFKTKNTLIFLKNHKKYSFYSIIYSYQNYCRIFSYALFGKRISDIFFIKDKVYFVPSRGKEVYIVDVTKEDLKKSIFNFLKDVVKGIEIKNVFIQDNCYLGFYNEMLSKVCLNSGFRILVVGNRRVKIISESDRNLPKKLEIDFGKKIMKIEIKEYIKPEKDPEKIFFNEIKGYKMYYVRNLLKLEKAIFMENKNEN